MLKKCYLKFCVDGEREKNVEETKKKCDMKVKFGRVSQKCKGGRSEKNQVKIAYFKVNYF